MDEITQDRRNINASKSFARTKAIKALETTRFEAYTGSGFNITITDLKGKQLCPEFLVNGEDMDQIGPPIVKSLKESMKLTRLLLLAELKDVDEVLTPPK